MSSGSLSNRSGGASAERKHSSGFTMSTATYSASSSQAAYASAEKSSGPEYGSSPRRYWSSSSSRNGSLVSNPSPLPSSAGRRSTRNAVPSAGLGGSSSTSGANGGSASRAPASRTRVAAEAISHPVTCGAWRSTPWIMATSMPLPL